MTILTFKDYCGELTASYSGRNRKGYYKVNGVTLKRSFKTSMVRDLGVARSRNLAYRQIYYAGGRSASATVAPTKPAMPPVDISKAVVAVLPLASDQTPHTASGSGANPRDTKRDGQSSLVAMPSPLGAEHSKAQVATTGDYTKRSPNGSAANPPSYRLTIDTKAHPPSPNVSPTLTPLASGPDTLPTIHLGEVPKPVDSAAAVAVKKPVSPAVERNAATKTKNSGETGMCSSVDCCDGSCACVLPLPARCLPDSKKPGVPAPSNALDVTVNKGADATCCNSIECGGCCFCILFAVPDWMCGSACRYYERTVNGWINAGECGISKERANDCGGNVCKICCSGLCTCSAMSTFTINRLCSDLQTANCTSCHAKTCCCDNFDPLRNPVYVNVPAKAAKLLGPTKASFKSPTAERGAQASGAVVDEKYRPTTAASRLQKPSHLNEHSVSRSVHWLTPPSTPRNRDNAKETRAQLPAINGFSGFPDDGDGALTARATPGAAASAAPAVTHVRERVLSRRRELYMDSSTVSTPAITTAVVNSAGASGAAAPPASSRRGRTWEAAPRRRTGDGDTTGPAAASHARTDSVFTGDPAVLTMFKGKTVELHIDGADVTIQPQPSAANFLN